MNAETNPLPTITLPASAEVLRAYGDEIHVLLTGGHTGNQHTMFTDLTPPAGGPPPHFHLKEDEWFFVLEGQASFLLDGLWHDAPAGTSVFAPQNSLHTFKNNGTAPLKQLVHTAPAGFETFFRKSAAEFQKPGGPDMAQLLAIGEEHDIYFPGLSPTAAGRQHKPRLSPAIIFPGEGRVLHLFGEEITIQFDARQTGGRFTVFLEVTQPGGGPPPHTVAHADEWFFVLEGRMSFYAQGRWAEVPPGTAFFAPRRSVRTFKNTGDKPSRMLVHNSPSGIEKFFDAAHEVFARSSSPDLGEAMALAAENGIQFVEG